MIKPINTEKKEPGIGVLSIVNINPKYAVPNNRKKIAFSLLPNNKTLIIVNVEQIIIPVYPKYIPIASIGNNISKIFLIFCLIDSLMELEEI